MSAATGTTAGGSQASTLHISPNQKRWAVFGIVLNKILAPKLRPYTDKNVSDEYENLKASHKIDTQSATSRLDRWPAKTSSSRGIFLKYENINGNNTLPKRHDGKPDYKALDCRVNSHADFAKLYLQDYMVKFTAFDDHCDASALLGLLRSVPAFSKAVQDAAECVTDARNSWAHCNFTEWDESKYEQSFQKMDQLVKAICLPRDDEQALLQDLDDWRTKGTILCMNSPVDPDLLRLVQGEVNDLEGELENLAFEVEEERDQARKALRSVKEAIDDLNQRMEKVESVAENHENRLAGVEETLSTMRLGKTEELSSSRVYTENQLNYFRACHIVHNLVPIGLREVFQKQWNDHYAQTHGQWQDGPKNGDDFTNMERKWSRSPNRRFLDTIRKGNSLEWDSTVLFFAIMNSRSIGATLDNDVFAAVDELRQVRNQIVHIPTGEISDVHFNKLVGNVVHSFLSLNLSTHDIVSIGNQTSFPTSELGMLEAQNSDLRKERDSQAKEVESKDRSFCNLAYLPPHDICSRTNEVDMIMQKIKRLDEENEAISTIYLSGNPGCGKTQLARQIGDEFYDRKTSDGESPVFVATMNAQSLETLADSYMALAKDLGITDYAATNIATAKELSAEATIKQLLSLMKLKIQNFHTWLIIADNVVDLAVVRNHLPPTGSKEWGHGLVLITTQDSSTIPTDAPNTWHKTLKAGMQPEDAVELLKRVSKLADQDEVVEEVAKKLDYQPLALAAAAYFVRTVVNHGSPNYSWEDYLKELREGKRKVIEETLANECRAYSETMTTAIRIAIDRAVTVNEVFRQMFSFLSLCAFQNVPLEAVVKFVMERIPNQTEAGIRATILRSPLILSCPDENGTERFFQMHRIVYDEIKNLQSFQYQSQERLQCFADAVKVFTSLIPEKDTPLSREKCRFLSELSGHCKYLCSIVTVYDPEEKFPHDLNVFISPDDFIRWLRSLADVCHLLTNLSLAKYFIQAAHDLVGKIGNTREGQHLKGNVLITYARVLSTFSENEAALLYAKDGKEILQKLFGETGHVHVAVAFSTLGTVNYDTGQFTNAVSCYQKALDIRIYLLGEEDGKVAQSYHDLGTAYNKLGMQAKAKGLYEKALKISVDTHGDDHKDVAEGYFNLGTFYETNREDAKAEEYHQKALNIRKKIYGEEHGAVAKSYSSLGTVYRNTGKYEQAEESYEEALRIWKKIYGEDHDCVVRCYGDLATLHRNRGNVEKAKELDDKALAICAKKHEL